MWLCNRIVIVLLKKTRKGVFQKPTSCEYYPLFPKKYYKVAVYGGSAAAGYTAPPNFSTVINHEIGRRRLKERKPFVMNFAASGMPFYNGQSVIAKEFMHYFDLTIIYAGNNEHQWTLADIIGNGNESYKHSVESWNSNCRRRFSTLRRWTNGIRGSTHLTSFGFNLLERIYLISKGRMARIFKTKMAETNKSDNKMVLKFFAFNMITSTPILPVLEKQQNIDLFVASVEDILDYASQIGKTVLVVGVVNNDLYSPTQSLMVGKTDNEIRVFEKTLLNIKKKIQENGNGICGVSDQLTQIAKEYPELAIVNYLLALIMFKDNRYEDGVLYLNKCFNEDYSIIGRVNESTNSRLDKICLSYKESTFVTPFGKFSQFLVDNNKYNQLFSDVQHPSSLGHILIAETILEHLGCQERSAAESADHFDALVKEENRFYDLLNVSDREIIYNVFVCFRWHLSCLVYVSDKGQYLEKASDYLEKWWGLAYKRTCRSNYYFWKGIIAANYHDDMSVENCFNNSKNINQSNFDFLISSAGAQGTVWRDYLGSLGYVL